MRASTFKLLSMALGLLAVTLIGCGQTNDDGYGDFALNEPNGAALPASGEVVGDKAKPDAETDSKEPDSESETTPKKTKTESPADAIGVDADDSKISTNAADIEDGSNTASASPPPKTPSTKTPSTKTKIDPLALGPGANPRAFSANPLRPALGPPLKPRKVKLLVKDRKFKVEGPQKALRISYDDFDLLKILNMEPVTLNATKLMPDWLKQLEGKRIRVRGFMYPPFQEEGLEGFVLARDNQICCFGRDPKPYDIVQVDMRKGKTTHYILNVPFDVVGVFHIDPVELDGAVHMVYRIDDATVVEK